MKKVLAACVLLATAMPAVHAQKTITFGKHHSGIPENFRQHMRQPVMANKLAAKTTASDVRLIAYASDKYNGVSLELYDSVLMSYSGTRGGVFSDLWKKWNWLPDQDIHLLYNSGTGSYDHPDFQENYTYDAANNNTGNLSQNWNTTTTVWENNDSAMCTYDAANHLISEIDLWWNTTSMVWNYQYRLEYTYTGTGNMSTYHEYTWNISSAMWDTSWQASFTYNTSDQLVTELWQYWTGTNWRDTYRYTYTYDASGNRTSEIDELDSGSGWDTSGKTISTDFDALGQAGTNIYQNWNPTIPAFSNSSRELYTFNSYNKIATYNSETWDAATSSWTTDFGDVAFRFYYESYDLAVETAPNTGVYELKVYPVPASDKLTISASGMQPGNYEFVLLDVTGKKVRNWVAAVSSSSTQQISLQGLVQGTYVLKCTGASGSVSHKIEIMK